MEWQDKKGTEMNAAIQRRRIIKVEFVRNERSSNSKIQRVDAINR